MRPEQPNIPCLCNVSEGEKEVVLIDEGKDSPLGQLVKRQWKQKDVSVVMRQRPSLRLQALEADIQLGRVFPVNFHVHMELLVQILISSGVVLQWPGEGNRFPRFLKVPFNPCDAQNVPQSRLLSENNVVAGYLGFRERLNYEVIDPTRGIPQADRVDQHRNAAVDLREQRDEAGIAGQASTTARLPP